MALDKIPQAPHEAQQAWAMFPKVLQVALHNEILTKVDALRDELEVAPPERVLEVQAAIRAHRFVFGLIHRKDKLPTK